jgi:hypothetical protein
MSYGELRWTAASSWCASLLNQCVANSAAAVPYHPLASMWYQGEDHGLEFTQQFSASVFKGQLNM